jgi:hypothetical protein
METASLISLTSGISPERAEDTAGLLDAERTAGNRVLLQFANYPYVNAGAGWRIGNALRPFGGTPLLEVHVPPFRKGSDWFRTFDRSGIGDAIAAHAESISSEDGDITADLRDHYRRHSVRAEQNAVFIGELHKGINFQPDRVELFRETFLHCLKYVNLQELYRRDGFLRVVIDTFGRGYEGSYQADVSGLETVVPTGNRSDAIKILRKLAEMGWGRFKVGRRGAASRFEGRWKLRDINVWASTPTKASAETGEPAAPRGVMVEQTLPAAGNLAAEKMVEHVFHLRSGLDLKILLPENLSKLEAARVAGFIQAIPF